MKFKTTKKAMKDYEPRAVGYCKLQSLLSYTDPIAYATRAEGWACDYYDLEGSNGRKLLISTGYAPQGEPIGYELTQKYEHKAEKIAYTMSYEDKKALLNDLIRAFVDEVLGNE